MWASAEEAEMPHIYASDSSANMHNNFDYKMKSDGRLKCRTTIGTDGIIVAYDVGSLDLGLRESFIDILKDIGSPPCSCTSNCWTPTTGDRFDRIVSYCDDLVHEPLTELLTTNRGTKPHEH